MLLFIFKFSAIDLAFEKSSAELEKFSIYASNLVFFFKKALSLLRFSNLKLNKNLNKLYKFIKFVLIRQTSNLLNFLNIDPGELIPDFLRRFKPL